MKILRVLFICIFALFAISTPLLASSQPSNKVMIILDASGSMWGQIKGVPKIQIARQVIHDLVKGWDPKLELGLVAYGHN